EKTAFPGWSQSWEGPGEGRGGWRRRGWKVAKFGESTPAGVTKRRLRPRLLGSVLAAAGDLTDDADQLIAADSWCRSSEAVSCRRHTRWRRRASGARSGAARGHRA